MRNSVIVCSLLFLGACAAPPGFTRKVGARANVVGVDSYDATVSIPGLSVSGTTDYSSIEIGPTFAYFDETGRKAKTSEVTVGFSEFGDLDAIEITGGGRHMLKEMAPASGAVLPFASFHAVSTIFESVGSLSPGTQLGLRFGFGVEVPIGASGLYFDVMGDYLIPLIEAQSSGTGSINTEVEGFAVRIGIGWEF